MNLNLLLLGTVMALTGCSSPAFRPVSTFIAAGGGAAAGSALSKGHPGGAAGGAAVGAALSEALFHAKTKSEHRAYQSGYQRALSDQMKSQYWRQQYRHGPEPSSVMEVPVPLPERITPDGVRLVPSTEFIRIHQ